MSQQRGCCYECPNRHVGCHADCEKYAEFRQRVEATKEARKQYINPEYVSYMQDIKTKRMRHAKIKKHARQFMRH